MQWGMQIMSVVAGCTLASVVIAAPLSDRHLKGFENAGSDEATGALSSPFVPQTVSRDDMLLEDLYLTGVVLGPTESYALISGQIVRANDRLAGYRVYRISRDYVTLKHRDKKHTLRMGVGRVAPESKQSTGEVKR